MKMAQFNSYPQKATPIAADTVLIYDSAGAVLKQVPIKNLFENYAGTSLGGSAQTVKSAIDALNSKTSINCTVTPTDVGSMPAIMKDIADYVSTLLGNANCAFMGNVFVNGVDAFTVSGSIRNSVVKFSAIKTDGKLFIVSRNAAGQVICHQVSYVS